MDSTGKQTTESIDDGVMTAVPKELFFQGMSLPVNIYCRLSRGHYLTIGKKGDKANFSDLHSFNHPQFKIFVKSMDHTLLIEYVTSLTEKFVGQKQVPDGIKTKFLMGLIDDSITCFDDKGLTSVAQLQRVSKIIVDLNAASSELNQALKILEELPANEAQHAMANCLLSLVIAEEMEMAHRNAQEKIVFASLLHDLGLKFIPQNILQKPQHLWTPEELALYQQHPLKSVELLRNLKGISNDVLLMIAEHHENSQGTGFPKRIRDVKISPLGRILILADYFSDLLFDTFQNGKSYTADEALAYIEDVLGQPFNRQVFMALKKVIHKNYLQRKQDAS